MQYVAYCGYGTPIIVRFSRVQVSSASVIAAIGDSCTGAFRRLTSLPIRLAQKHSCSRSEDRLDRAYPFVSWCTFDIDDTANSSETNEYEFMLNYSKPTSSEGMRFFLKGILVNFKNANGRDPLRDSNAEAGDGITIIRLSMPNIKSKRGPFLYTLLPRSFLPTFCAHLLLLAYPSEQTPTCPTRIQTLRCRIQSR